MEHNKKYVEDLKFTFQYGVTITNLSSKGFLTCYPFTFQYGVTIT